MRIVIMAAVMLLLVVSAGCTPDREGAVVRRSGEQQDVQLVRQTNEKMNAAFGEARQNLPQFLQAMKAPKPGQQFTVKVKVTDGTHTEYMWLRDLTYDGSQFHGALVDDPYEVKGYHMGQVMNVPSSQIADWIIMEDGTITAGGYTQKVLDEMKPE
jgi:uncharacterized protein YegJ (DUF2314 family)